MIDKTRIDPKDLTLFLNLPTRWNPGLPVESRELVCVR
jgi:hypothetical protein